MPVLHREEPGSDADVGSIPPKHQNFVAQPTVNAYLLDTVASGAHGHDFKARLKPPSGHTAKGKVGSRLCNLVHCCRAVIGVMPREPYCRSMREPPSDEDVSRQILGIFMRYRIPARGTLQRNCFFEVRDGDFQRGINKAVANNWITVDLRNRYRYQLTTTGYDVGRMIHPVHGT